MGSVSVDREHHSRPGGVRVWGGEGAPLKGGPSRPAPPPCHREGPTCHDLAELIDGDPATAWAWGDREGECTALGGQSLRPVTPSPDHKRREKTIPPLETLEADQ
jgi:hypothetical protein